ncbi:amino acid ABC transporter substrate-binding protein [Egicoccus sp. AB-alg6-2]|uniref:amino acid ABC transporter substrate-binding protein n=1 Tax=Egicoccus sp. AB-alg6-2 TaxID=3242692 RepID=UPI00359DB17C
MRVRSRWIALLAAMSLGVVACGGADTTEPDAAAPEDTAPDDGGDDAEGETGEDGEAAPEPSGDPIQIGGALALTGPFAPTAKIHEIVAEQFVEMLNEQGGLLGRPVEWTVLDDESQPEQSAALYERLITQDGVDLVMGPYGTGSITAAMAVAERYGYVFPHHTASLTYAYTYDKHFPTWFVGLNTHHTTPRKVFEAYESLGDDAPQTVAFVTNRFPGTDFLVYGVDGDQGALRGGGGALRVAEEMGLDVVLDLSFDIGTTDFSGIAQRVAEADADLLYVGALGEDGTNLLASLAQLGYTPRNHFYQWPAPGPMLAAGELAEGATSVTIFEPYEPYLSNEGAQELVDRYRAGAEEEGLSYTDPETQAGASWAAWQVLVAGVEGCQCLDHDEIADWLLNNPIDTVQGTFEYRADEQNYGDDIQTIKQIQDGGWYVVHPEDAASDGRSLQAGSGD